MKSSHTEKHTPLFRQGLTCHAKETTKKGEILLANVQEVRGVRLQGLTAQALSLRQPCVTLTSLSSTYDSTGVAMG